MEINPRIGGNFLPFYEEVTGYNPWKSYESIREGKVPKKSCEAGSGVCRYNWHFDCEDGIYEDDKGNYTVKSSQYSHTYVYSPEKKMNYDKLLRYSEDVFEDYKKQIKKK